MKKILLVGALGATALCAVAFSPGLAILLAVLAIVLVVASDTVPRLKLMLASVADATDHRVTGHGHVSRADGLGAGGRHGSPSTIVVMLLAVWALIMSISSRASHAVSKLATSAGHALTPNNMSAQPLPS
ncbi:hypothetical protein K2P47_04665 [Patescibacteria group bacterium]|nr:hypothetical protein [Patescibacteria group bacterium]